MTAAPEPRAIELFLDALELPAPARDAMLRTACGDDMVLRARVDALLAANARADRELGTLSDATTVAMPSPPFEFAPGAQIGPYRLEQQIAEGGFGTVWRAEQLQPVRRRVALKVLKPTFAGSEVVIRFGAERQALALMDHPNIARVFDGGETDAGRPYFAMEFVDGPPITTFCERHQLALRDRLQLFATVCQAVHHAHQRGVIHRDIKPSNVLVARVDGRPVPKVIDFGIAKAAGATLAEVSQLTIGGQLMGTPAYMSPEQARGALDIDVRTDVYSLGVLCYELLCGEPPFRFDDLRGAGGIAAAMRTIAEVDAEPPSLRLARRTAHATSLVSARQVRGDLDWIALCCLDKDPARRYDSVAALAADVARHLDGRPVVASPPSFRYRAQKFARRHRLALSALTIVLVTLIASSVFAWRQAHLATQAAAATEIELARFRTIAGFFEHLLVSIDPKIAKGADTTLLRRILERATHDVTVLADGPPIVEATLRRAVGGGYYSIADYQSAETQLRIAHRIRNTELGPRHHDTIESQGELGGVLLALGRVDEAVELLEPCAAVSAEAFGPDDVRTLRTRSSVAVAYRSLHRWTDAADLLAALEADCDRALGPRHSVSMLVRNNRAGVLEDLGQHVAAAQIYERVLADQLATNGERHPDTLKTLSNLAGVQQRADRLDLALPLLERALAIKRAILPAGHPSLLIGLNNLASAREDNGEDADALYDEGLALAHEHLGARHRLTLHFRTRVARRDLRAGRHAIAAEDLGQIVATCQDALDPDDHVTLAAISDLGDACLQLGQSQRALTLARENVAAAARALPPSSTAHGVYRVQLGLALAALGRNDEALAALREGQGLLEGHGATRWLERAAAALTALGEPSKDR